MLSWRTPLRAVACAVAALLWALPARAGLHSVSGWPTSDVNVLSDVTSTGAKQDVAYSLANGFPLWFKDDRGVKLALCLDEAATVAGRIIDPCLAAPLIQAPLSFPNNFPEAFWWMATGEAFFAGGTGHALVVLSQEAAFADDLTLDGNQAAFGRIRIRVKVPEAGTYRVTHPYGVATYHVPASAIGPGLERQIDQTQDVGNHLPPPPGEPPLAGAPPQGNFLLALANGPAPVGVTFPLQDPHLDVGIVSSASTGIGPFLVPAEVTETTWITADGGARYLSDPGTVELPNLVAVTGGVNAFFKVERLVEGGDPLELLLIDRFQVLGKLFDDRDNQAPVAGNDFAATAAGATVSIDVLENDSDPVGPEFPLNAHGIDPQAIGLPLADGTILLTKPLRTAKGGTVRRSTVMATGETTFLYTPAPGFTGEDSFQYVVQDTGGLVSAPATVTILVEDLRVASAEFRARTGKWRIRGTSSDRTDNQVTLVGGPRAHLDGTCDVPQVTSAVGAVSLRPTSEAIEYRVTVSPLPASAVREAHVHVVGEDGRIGSVIFYLHDAVVDGEFAGSRSGTLTEAQLIPRPAEGIHTIGDAVEAVLAGRAHVDVHTAARPGGELCGRVGSPVIGTAVVDASTGEWTFEGKSIAGPGGPPASVTARSTNGIRSPGAALRVR